MSWFVRGYIGIKRLTEREEQSFAPGMFTDGRCEENKELQIVLKAQIGLYEDIWRLFGSFFEKLNDDQLLIQNSSIWSTENIRKYAKTFGFLVLEKGLYDRYHDFSDLFKFVLRWKKLNVMHFL